MSDQEPERLLQGPDEPPLAIRLPSPPPWVRVVAAVAVVLVAGGLLLTQRHHQGPVARPTQSASEGPLVLPPTTYFNVTARCQPVLGSNNVLTLSFTLTNITSSNVTVRRIEPNFPIGGLQASGVDIAGGVCGQPAGAPAGTDIASGASLLVTFRLLLPTSCPAPYPVAARVVVLPPSGLEQADVVLVYPDLGDIDFPSCP